MPFNSSGVFTLYQPAGVVTGTIVSSAWANNSFSDFQTAFNNCVLRDGTATLGIPIPFFAGTVGAPGINFGDTDTGIYKAGSGQLGVAASGTAAGLFTSTGFQGKIGQTTPAAAAFTTATATTLNATTANVTTLNATTANVTALAVSGTITMSAAVSKIVPGATSFSHRNNADSADNLIILDNGNTTIRGSLNAQGGFAGGALTLFTSTLGADVPISTSSGFFDGPSVAQGTAGTWLATGQIQFNATVSSQIFNVKLWDGTNNIAEQVYYTNAGVFIGQTALSGVITNPVGNIRLSVHIGTAGGAGAKILKDAGDSSNAASVVSALRIS